VVRCFGTWVRHIISVLSYMIIFPSTKAHVFPETKACISLCLFS
jgi:hypothetical protein